MVYYTNSHHYTTQVNNKHMMFILFFTQGALKKKSSHVLSLNKSFNIISALLFELPGNVMIKENMKIFELLLNKIIYR